jgi:hypothetical protein
MTTDDDDGMMTVRVPRDSTVLIVTATAEGEVTKAADIAAAKAAAETKE